MVAYIRVDRDYPDTCSSNCDVTATDSPITVSQFIGNKRVYYVFTAVSSNSGVCPVVPLSCFRHQTFVLLLDFRVETTF